MDYGLIVDVETTGLEASKDKVIEIGICEFGWEDGASPILLNMYGGLQDPGSALPPEITKITGITDAALRGQEIDWQLVRSLWERATIVIAHNAQFDRSFLMARPELRDMPKHWACSVRHIDWEEQGMGSRKLQYLAADHGFVNPFAHRALFDCATTFRLVAPHMKELVTNSYEPEYKIIAAQSPFESKDVLRARGYRWDNEGRVWHKTILSKHLAEERQFLSAEVYKGYCRHIEEQVWFNPDSNF